MVKIQKKTLLKFGIPLVVLVAAYFINVEIQTKLGEKVLEETGLEYLGYDAALAKSKSTGKPVLLDVSAIWCPSCRAFDKQVLSDARVKEVLREDYVFARVEYEEDSGIRVREKYNIDGFPRLLVLDSQGDVIKRLPVVFEADAFLSAL